MRWLVSYSLGQLSDSTFNLPSPQQWHINMDKKTHSEAIVSIFLLRRPLATLRKRPFRPRFTFRYSRRPPAPVCYGGFLVPSTSVQERVLRVSPACAERRGFCARGRAEGRRRPPNNQPRASHTTPPARQPARALARVGPGPSSWGSLSYNRKFITP